MCPSKKNPFPQTCSASVFKFTLFHSSLRLFNQGGFFSLLSPSHLPISILSRDTGHVVTLDKHVLVLLRLTLDVHVCLI